MLAEVTEALPAAAEAGPPLPLGVVVGWGVIGLLSVALAWRLGALRGETLRRGPTRDLGLGGVDYLLGFGAVGLLYVPQGVAMLQGYGLVAARVVEATQPLGALALILGSAYFVARSASRIGGLRRAGLWTAKPGRDAVVSLAGLPVATVLTFATLGVVAYVAALAGRPSPEINHGLLEQLRESPDAATVTGIVVAAVVVGPLLEELLYRGLLQTWLLHAVGWRHRWAVLLTASALFAVVHLGATTWHALPGLFVLAVVLGWLYERTGSLWPAVLVHAGFNAINITMVLVGVGGSEPG